MPGVWCATGHRPDKLGGWQIDTHRRIMARAWTAVGVAQPDRLIVGMAAGWDLAMANAAIEAGIPWTAAIPCEGQETRWSIEWQRLYWELLNRATQVKLVTPGPYTNPGVLHVRNHWMVDNAPAGVLALWNGDKNGGTAGCLAYAKRKGRRIENFWPLVTHG